MTWGVAVMLPNHHQRVIDQVIEVGLGYLFPRVKRMVRRRGRRVTLLEPLLFNYLPVVLSRGWEKLFDMRGVMDVIGPASDEEMDRLSSYCGADGIMILPEIPEFRINQSVRVLSEGPIRDVVGSYRGKNNRGREIAVFNFFGSMRTLEFDQGDLVAA